MSMIEVALKSRDLGLSVVPIEAGTKKALVKWSDYQSQPMGHDEIREHFAGDVWFAIIAGEVSGNLELIDFDIPRKHKLPKGTQGTAPLYQPFCDFLIEHGHEDLLNRLIVIQTKSGGMGLIYRCPDGVSGNQKLAERPATPEELEEEPSVRRHALIETRGTGGYFLTFPTPGYKFLRGKFTSIPTISAEERELLLSVARFFNECEPEVYAPERSNPHTQRPGDEFNLNTTWDDILSPAGWHQGRRSGNRTMWTRPGKTLKDGNSATTGNGPNDLLYVFTSSAYPFEPSRSYSKFAAYALINHGGDFHFAAQALKEKGFGSPRRQEQRVPGPEAPPCQAYEEAVPAPRYNLRKASDVEAKTVEWLLYPYIPLGMLAGCEGMPGLGKTFVLLSMASALSRGRGLSFMDSQETEPVTTIYWTLDDSAEYVLKPRLQRMDADLNKIILCDDSLVLNRQGLRDLREIIKETEAKWFVLDPFAKFIDPVIKMARPDISLSEIMTELKTICEQTGCAITPNRHLRKSRSGDVISDGYGGIEIIGGYRSALRIDADPDNIPRQGSKFGIVSHIKNNVGPIGEAFGFEIRPVNKELAELWWTGTREFDPAAAPQVQPDTPEIKDARAFLLHELQTGRMEAVSALEAIAAKQGITPKQLRTAREHVCEPSQRIGFGKDSKVFIRLKRQFIKEDPYA